MSEKLSERIRNLQMVTYYSLPGIAAEVAALESRLASAERERDAALNQLEWAWTIIANANGGDWDKAHPDWKKAAEKWRDEVMPGLSKYRAAPASSEVRAPAFPPAAPEGKLYAAVTLPIEAPPAAPEKAASGGDEYCDHGVPGGITCRLCGRYQPAPGGEGRPPHHGHTSSEGRCPGCSWKPAPDPLTPEEAEDLATMNARGKPATGGEGALAFVIRIMRENLRRNIHVADAESVLPHLEAAAAEMASLRAELAAKDDTRAKAEVLRGALMDARTIIDDALSAREGDPK